MLLVACLCTLASGCSTPSLPHLSFQSGLLVATDQRWLGGDGAFSSPMEGGMRLWLFGDTWLSLSDDGVTLVSNTVGIQNGPCEGPITAFWREEGGRPAAVFVPADGRGWLWPAGGSCLEGHLHLFFHRMDRGESGGAWDFFPRGTELIRIKGCRGPPEAWEMDRVLLPWKGEEFLLGSAPIAVGNYVLAYGSRPAGPAREMVLARIRIEAFLRLEMDRWEYFSGDGKESAWSPLPGRAKGLFRGIGTEFTVARDPNDGGWVCVYTPRGIAPEVHLRRAPHPHGPWGPAVVLYTCPEEAGDPNLYCYGAKLHPECLGGGRMGSWITYTVNAKDSTPPRADEAKPRWVWITRQDQ